MMPVSVAFGVAGAGVPILAPAPALTGVLQHRPPAKAIWPIWRRRARPFLPSPQADRLS